MFGDSHFQMREGLTMVGNAAAPACKIINLAWTYRFGYDVFKIKIVLQTIGCFKYNPG